jgi:hypothetical protein
MSGAVENWDSELLVPAQGRLVYMGQEQAHFVHFHEPTPGLLRPKKKKKKKATPQPPAPSPPVGEDWEAEIAATNPPPPAVRGLGCRDCEILVGVNNRHNIGYTLWCSDLDTRVGYEELFRGEQ